MYFRYVLEGGCHRESPLTLMLYSRTLLKEFSVGAARVVPTLPGDEDISGWLISTVSDPSGSGQVDMLTSPVAAARAAVATGAWVKSKHKYLIRGSVGAQALFLSVRLRNKKKEAGSRCIPRIFYE